MQKGKITPNNILHFNKKTSDDEADTNKITLDNLLDNVTSDNISDAMKNLYAKHSLVRGIKPINSKYKVSGFIRTAETNSDDWGTCIKAIYECNPNEILFIKCSNEDYAVWGELASTAAKKHGLLATVIFGSSRDTNDVLKLDYPLFSSSIQSRAGGAYNNGTIGEDIIIDDLIIRTGDFIICDVDGVVVVNKENLDEVLEEVNKIKEFENNCLRELFDEDKQLDTILDL